MSGKGTLGSGETGAQPSDGTTGAPATSRPSDTTDFPHPLSDPRMYASYCELASATAWVLGMSDGTVSIRFENEHAEYEVTMTRAQAGHLAVALSGSVAPTPPITDEDYSRAANDMPEKLG